MTDTAQERDERASVRVPTGKVETTERIPAPGPRSLFVVFAAVSIGIVSALAFQTTNPDTKFVILGGTVLCAAALGVVGLYRYSWFLLITLAIRPALDDLIADEFGTFQPSAILGILVILVTALHLISIRAHRRWKRLTPLGWAFIGFFVLFVPSFITSVDRGASQSAMFGLASVALLYVAMEQQLLTDRGFLWKMLTAAAIGMIVPIVTGFVQFFWTGTLDPGGSGLIRVDGSFAHPNTFATYLAFASLLSIGAISAVPVKQRLLVLLAACLSGFLLIATFARGAWASFLLGALLMAARVNKKAVWVILAGAIGVAAVMPGVGDRLSNLTSETGARGGAKTDDSIAWRIGYWGKVAPFFNRNPLSGIGVDTTKTLTFEAKDPHNSFLQAFVEGGVLGGFAFIVLLSVATIAAMRVWRMVKRNELDHRTKMISVGAIAGLFTVAAQLITENVLLNTVVWWYLNIAFAHLAVLSWRRERPPEPDLTRLQLPAAGETGVYEGIR